MTPQPREGGTSPAEGSGGLELRLFVSGATHRSMRAVAAVRGLCDRLVPGGYRLDVVDIYRDPAAARAYQIVAVPTLLKMAPIPKRLFIGDMTNTAPLLAGLGLPTLAGAAGGEAFA